MRGLTNKEQILYDRIIRDLNRYISNVTIRACIIEELDNLVEILMDPYMTEDEAVEFFGGGK